KAVFSASPLPMLVAKRCVIAPAMTETSVVASLEPSSITMMSRKYGFADSITPGSVGSSLKAGMTRRFFISGRKYPVCNDYFRIGCVYCKRSRLPERRLYLLAGNCVCPRDGCICARDIAFARETVAFARGQ